MPSSEDNLAGAREALTGSRVLGEYVSPTVVDRLIQAVIASFREIDRLGIRDRVTTISSGDAAPPKNPPASVLDDLLDQVTLRWAFPNGRPRTLAELAKQLEVNLVAIRDAGSGSTTTPSPSGPRDLRNVLWAADYTGETMSRCGFREIQVQNSKDNSSIRTNRDDFPVAESPIGRAVVFQMDDGQVRREGNPNKANSFDGSGTSYHSLRFYLTKGFPVEVDDWQLIWQNHGNDTTSPKFALQLRNNELRIGDTKGGWSGRISTETAYGVVIKCDRGAGRISVWVNGQLKLDGYQCGKSATPYYSKVGLYHTVRIRGGRMYQNGHAIGTTYESVAQYL